MALTLVYTGETSVPVEVEGLTPDWACNKSLTEIERFEIFYGNRKILLAEMFAVSGDPSDKRFDIKGDLAGVHWIGAHMASGEIHIEGNAGRHLGSEMRGGEIHVSGNAGGWVGAEMHAGLICVKGSAGHLIGGAYRGSAKGMTGGMIVIEGSAGNEIGHTMRRGMIAIGKQAGDMVGFNMIAGTILVFGECGIRVGAGMRRGTIGLFGSKPPAMLPTFRFACTYQPQVIPLMFRELRSRGMTIENSLDASKFDLYHGDLIEVGKGEILLRHAG